MKIRSWFLKTKLNQTIQTYDIILYEYRKCKNQRVPLILNRLINKLNFQPNYIFIANLIWTMQTVRQEWNDTVQSNTYKSSISQLSITLKQTTVFIEMGTLFPAYSYLTSIYFLKVLPIVNLSQKSLSLK